VKQSVRIAGEREFRRRNLFEAAENLCHSVEASQPNALKREAAIIGTGEFQCLGREIGVTGGERATKLASKVFVLLVCRGRRSNGKRRSSMARKSSMPNDGTNYLSAVQSGATPGCRA
jgi:hypothetical protein